MSNGWWGPLWVYCEHVAPEVARKVRNPFANDGDGLDAADAMLLASRLRAEILGGRCALQEARLNAELDTLPDVTCAVCGGRGERVFPDTRGKLPCNACRGEGESPRVHIHRLSAYAAFARPTFAA
jgi:hypothetical protein